MQRLVVIALLAVCVLAPGGTEARLRARGRKLDDDDEDEVGEKPRRLNAIWLAVSQRALQPRENWHSTG